MMLKRLKFLRFLRKEDGNATIEFCMVFPFVLAIFGSTFEASLISTRQMLMTASLDMTVRDLQLGNLGDPTHDELKVELCNRAGFIPDCTNSMHIELERVATDSFAFRTGEVQCVDKDEESEPAVNFSNWGPNDLMLITVCAAFKPMVPVTGLGLMLPKINDGTHYGLVAISAYVVEPA